MAAGAQRGCKDRDWVGGEGCQMPWQFVLRSFSCPGADVKESSVLQNFLCPVPEADTAFSPCLDLVGC